MKNELFKVNMFGDFEAYYGGKVIVGRDDRASKPVQLFAYFLCNQNKPLSQSELINVILKKEGESPESVLKNIIYRLRKMISAAGMSEDCIRYSHSAYTFSYDGVKEIDIDRFLQLTEHAGSKSGEEALGERLEAVSLYKGELLSKMSDEPWVVELSLMFQRRFLNCIERLCEFRGDEEYLPKLISALNTALVISPYDDDILCALVNALYSCKRVKEAVEQCERFSELLYNDLGIEPSAKVRELYKKVLGGTYDTIASVSELRGLIAEEETNGAYYCSLEVFKSIYHFSVRQTKRTGQSIFLMLCSIREKDGDRPSSGARLSAIAATMKDTVQRSLRSGDVYARTSPSQYVLMLTDINEECCDVVEGRLRKNFYNNGGMKETRLLCEHISAIDIDKLF